MKPTMPLQMYILHRYQHRTYFQRLAKSTLSLGSLHSVLYWRWWFLSSSTEVFLLLIGAIFVPLFGVVLTDYYIVKRKKYTEQMLYVRQNGLGIGVPAIIAWTLGVLLNYVLSPLSPIYIPQLPAIGATIPSLAAASVIYLAITKMQRRQRGEVMTKI